MPSRPDEGCGLRELYSQAWLPWLHRCCHPFEEHHHNGESCKNPGKVPLDWKWQEKAPKRAEHPESIAAHVAQLEEHLARGSNIGLVVPPGYLVLDADSQEAAALLVEAMPDAPFQRTNSGGHIWVWRPAEVPARCKVELFEGVRVDLRVGGKNQVVVDPSIHASGSMYTWGLMLPDEVRHV